MNKGLDLIQRQQLEEIDGYPTGNVYIGLTFEELSELEKELKALEIIKKKKVDMGSLIRLSKGETRYKEIASRYNTFRVKNERLTSKEVGLLVEIFE